MKILNFIKKTFPPAISQTLRDMKVRAWNLTKAGTNSAEHFESQFPWVSPDIWERIENFYLALSAPVIFEYGTGVSSIWHIRNLLKCGGKYIGVEHKGDWYTKVLNEVVLYAVQHNLTINDYWGNPVTKSDFPIDSYDTSFKLAGVGTRGCEVKLKLRPPYHRSDDGDGTFEEFREYVKALDEPCEMVIVDGRARKACINYVLDNPFLNLGGLLALFDAGRGQDGWQGWPALIGTSDYQPEVRRMIRMGGELVDGAGIDNWPGLKRRRTPGSNAYFFHMEACFLEVISKLP